MTVLLPALPSRARASEPHAPGSGRAGGPGTGAGPVDLGRHLRRAREEMGLTRAEVSARARMDEGYLTYLEESSALPAAGAVLKLARALGTTAEHLLGVQQHRQSLSAAGPSDRAGVLGPERCWQVVGDRGAARVVLEASSPGGEPSLRVVDYAVSGHVLVFPVRAGSGVVLAARRGERVLVEVDHLDAHHGDAATVLLGGTARLLLLGDPLVDAHPSQPAPGAVLVAVEPAWVTGRRSVAG